MHHIKLDVGSGDKVIIGASSEKHLEKNLLDFEKGSLPDDVVQALDEVWRMARGVARSYYCRVGSWSLNSQVNSLVRTPAMFKLCKVNVSLPILTLST